MDGVDAPSELMGIDPYHINLHTILTFNWHVTVSWSYQSSSLLTLPLLFDTLVTVGWSRLNIGSPLTPGFKDISFTHINLKLSVHINIASLCLLIYLVSLSILPYREVGWVDGKRPQLPKAGKGRTLEEEGTIRYETAMTPTEEDRDGTTTSRLDDNKRVGLLVLDRWIHFSPKSVSGKPHSNKYSKNCLGKIKKIIIFVTYSLSLSGCTVRCSSRAIRCGCQFYFLLLYLCTFS